MRAAAVRLAVAAMGTRCEVVVLEGRGNLLAAGEAALAEIEHWHARLSRFAEDSLVSHINRTAAHVPVRLDRDVYALFDDALTVWRASGGAFDVTVAPLMARHGFQNSAVKGRVGATVLTLDPGRWTISLSPGTSIDLGAIAKGHAFDCAAGVLRSAGVTSALLHGGTSSVVAIGAPPGEPAWQVAVGSEQGAPVVRLRDTAMSVSNASSQRGESRDNGHILDPRTGRPAAFCGRVVVVGPSARLADAWSTALAVLRRVPDDFPPGFTVRFGVKWGSVPTLTSI